MRYPGPGIGSIAVDFKRYVSAGPVLFVGDVDGDARDDLFLAQNNLELPGQPGEGILLYGAPRSAVADGSAIESLRQTRFLASAEMPFAALEYGSPGDVDGDGHADLTVSDARTAWRGVRGSGLSMVVYGAPSFPAELSFARLEESGARTQRFFSGQEDRHTGEDFAVAGDLNGDGRPDFAIAAWDTGSEDGLPVGGRVYIVYGDATFEGAVNLDEVGASVPGFIIHGAYGQGGGRRFDAVGCCGMLQALGDVTGDGLDDLGIGTLGVRDGLGVFYVLKGGTPPEADLFVATPEDPLVELRGPIALGRVFERLGDLDHDGIEDFLVSAPEPPSQVGHAFIVYGSSTWPTVGVLGEPDVRAFQLTGTRVGTLHAPHQGLGWSQANIGDWNGDGFVDFIVSSHHEPVRLGKVTGAAYLIEGGPHLDGIAFDTAVGTEALPGWAIQGFAPWTQFGDSVAGGGDFDGDGKSDFLIASSTRPRTPTAEDLMERSKIFLFFGGAALRDDISVAAVTPSTGSSTGGYDVSVFGRGFAAEAQVRFGGAAAESRPVSSAEIRAVVPAGLALGSVEVEVQSGGKTASLTDGFKLIDMGPWPNLPLDAADLKQRGYRTLSLDNVDYPALRQGTACCFANVFFHDLDADGTEDLVIGERYAEPPLQDDRVTVLFGRRGGFPDRLSLGTEMAGVRSTTIRTGGATRVFAAGVTFPGDLDQDGHEDLALGPYLIFGRATWPTETTIAAELSAGTALELPQDGCAPYESAGLGYFEATGNATLATTFNGCAEGASQVSLYLEGVSPAGLPAPSTLILADPTKVVLPHLANSSEPRPRRLGFDLSAGGDMNGDGAPDLIVGADHHAGSCYLILGPKVDFLSTTVKELVDVGRAVRVHRDGIVGSGLAFAVVPGGDINGDGLDDALIGAPLGGSDIHGSVYVVFGTVELGRTIHEIDLLSAGAERVVELVGRVPYEWAGWVESLGDVNRDGFGDFGITGENHLEARARAYVVFGGTGLPRRLSLEELGSHGFSLEGAPGTWLSTQNGGIGSGDLDGDGAQEIALGLAHPDGQGGYLRRVLVIFGKGGSFVRGDANEDGKVDISDAVRVLSYLFLGAAPAFCLQTMDANDTGSLDLTDAVYLLNGLFQGGDLPPPPYPEPGQDPSPDDLDC